MTMTEEIRAFLDANIVGALATSSAAGRVHNSLVYYVREGDRLFISTETQRRKAQDVRETGWASVCVMGHERPFPSVNVAGPASLRTEEIGGLPAGGAPPLLGLAGPPEGAA